MSFCRSEGRLLGRTVLLSYERSLLALKVRGFDGVLPGVEHLEGHEKAPDIFAVTFAKNDVSGLLDLPKK